MPTNGWGSALVTYQTGPVGQPVECLLVEACTDIADELYLGAVLDRSSRRVVFIASAEGGVDIEKVAAETPEKLLYATLDPLTGAQPYQARQLAYDLGLDRSQTRQFADIFLRLAKIFVERDLSLLEINPLRSGGVTAGPQSGMLGMRSQPALRLSN